MILCGGESGEHEVSLQSANSIIKYIPRDRYRVISVGINKEGEWLTGNPLFENENDPSDICLASGLVPAKLERGCLNGIKIDAVFSIIHGTYGEDGCLQGLLQMQHIPYVGSDVLGSAVGMDKDIMKRLFFYSGIECANYTVAYRWQNKKPDYDEISEQLGEILFVKPCNLGSSVGISKARNKVEFDTAIEYAFQFDKKVIIEEFIKGREIEISVLGNQEPEASIPGEIIPGEEFYSYDSKYIESDKTILEIPAKLEIEMIQRIQAIAKRSFGLLELSGLARIDFFVQKNKRIVLNEVNTLPGFTNISMYPKLWEASGMPYPELIHRLIELAIAKYDLEKDLKRNKY